MKNVSVHFDSPEMLAVCAVDDHFGSTYRRFRRSLAVGEVYGHRVIHRRTSKRLIPLGDNGESLINCRIIKPVHHNTVRALVRRSDHPTARLSSGKWYEVICD